MQFIAKIILHRSLGNNGYCPRDYKTKHGKKICQNHRYDWNQIMQITINYRKKNRLSDGGKAKNNRNHRYDLFNQQYKKKVVVQEIIKTSCNIKHKNYGKQAGKKKQ